MTDARDRTIDGPMTSEGPTHPPLFGLTIAPGPYVLDPRASAVSFTFRTCFGLLRVSGRVDIVSGRVAVSPRFSGSAAEATVATSTVTTGNPRRDRRILSASFLDARAHPFVSFHSVGVRPESATTKVDGIVMVRDRCRPVVLMIHSVEPYGEHGYLVTLGAVVDRHSHGVSRLRRFVGGTLDIAISAHLLPDLRSAEWREIP